MTAPIAASTRNCQPWFVNEPGVQSGGFQTIASAGLPFAPPVMLSSAWSFARTGNTAARASVTRAR